MDKLKFLGCGSGFYPTLGSTSAYFIEGKTLFLIDCGESAYRRIWELNLLDGIDTLNFFCTHTHSDHIGSVGNLLLECKFRRKIAFNLICPHDATHLDDITGILDRFKSKKYYSVIEPENIDHLYKSFKAVRYEPALHGDCENAHSLVFYTDEGVVYYSGDNQTMGFAEELILSGAKIAALYFDVNSNPNCDCHLPITDLYRILPKQFYDRTYCMHFNDQKCVDMAKSLGFNVVQPE